MVENVLINFSFIILLTYFCLKTNHSLHMLQLESYMNKRYLKWIINNKAKVFNIKEILIAIGLFILLLMKQNLIVLILLDISFLILILSKKKTKAKKPFVATPRIKRMYSTYALLFCITYVSMYFFDSYLILLKFLFLIVFSYFITIIINIINNPIERLINKKFYKLAEKKLKDMPDLKVIGITGSYGKTSTKNIITTILAQKYSVLATPESYNTTLGVVRTINEKLEAIHQIFICEMGAKEIGDIKEICNLVKPKYGILTAIGPQHLETFKTLENVIKTKSELIESLPEDGIAILNYTDENIRTLKTEQSNIKFGLDSTECDYYAENITTDETGSNFDVHMRNGEIIRVSSKLLGELNIINIVGAVAIADSVGLSIDEIKVGIKHLKPVEHRLELKIAQNGMIIIDDAYNSNTKGAKMALEVLEKFKNKQRILITPGIVDLGDKTYEYNQLLGKQAAKSADFVILVGEKQAVPIQTGLFS